MMWYWFNEPILLAAEIMLAILAIICWISLITTPSSNYRPRIPLPERPPPPQGSGGQTSKNYLEAMKVVKDAGTTTKEAVGALGRFVAPPTDDLDFDEWKSKVVEKNPYGMTITIAGQKFDVRSWAILEPKITSELRRCYRARWSPETTASIIATYIKGEELLANER